MKVRVGVVSVAHLHAVSFVSGFHNHPDAEVVGVWDHDAARADSFARGFDVAHASDLDVLLEGCDAVVICSENMRHLEYIRRAVAHDLHILCEKPIVPVAEQVADVEAAIAGSNKVLMTSFPCPFSPDVVKGFARIKEGEIGNVLSVCTTNQGTCPFGWFVEKEHSGGGALVDHVVHVADLLARLIGKAPESVQAQAGNNMYGQEWEDTGMVTVNYPGGVFATIDSSWSKPKGYRTWGNVKMNIIGDKGVMEFDLFDQGVHVTKENGMQHRPSGSNLDALMVAEFMNAIKDNRKPSVTLADGIAASKVAHAATASVSSGGSVVQVN